MPRPLQDSGPSGSPGKRQKASGRRPFSATARLSALNLRQMSTGPFFNVFSLLSVAPQAFVAVDASLGQHPVKSLAGLRQEVLNWRDQSQPDFSDADCERLVTWLNRNFYRLDA